MPMPDLGRTVSILTSPRTSIACLAGVSLMVASLAGCSRSVGATASGTVTVDGKPAPAGIRVDFEPQFKGGSSSSGYTDAVGRYTLMFNVNTVGVMPGESVVRLSIQPTFSVEGKPSLPEELRAIRLPDSVGIKSTLRRTVKPGANQIDIDVETAAAGKP
ncbi:hypothetical protein EBR56_10480 [bacterium]|nr:hypothetical protein [bacterium]